MARKTAGEEPLLPGLDETLAAAAPAGPAKSSPRREGRAQWSYAVRGIILGFVLIALLVGYFRAQEYLSLDARFALTRKPGDSGSLKLRGIRHASPAQVSRVFEPDFDRSIALLPLQARRSEVMAIDWVRSASITRIWPDQVVVSVVEREPLAYVPVTAESRQASRFALIDEDGVILPAPPGVKFELPVVLGIRTRDQLVARRDRIRRVQRMLRDLGEWSAKLSEIDAQDPENLKIHTRLEDRMLILLMGDRSFRSRLETFFNYYPKVRQTAPDATTFDLRIDDRITALEGE